DSLARSIATITRGRYAQAWIDPADFTIRVRPPEGGGTVDDEALSTGTIEQLQFALRAALAAALGKGECVPLLYDDALAHADDARLRCALEHAAELGAAGQQILFFSQRGDVETFALDAAVTIIRLPGPDV
ncbi:MAG TPA: hypothetical protein VEJ20_00805, partial [Candidatus Eremiobacteraceae bacterium]|nr:hypothetical protein [Candidatus Eremiobacteraceae bacterium]